MGGPPRPAHYPFWDQGVINSDNSIHLPGATRRKRERDTVSDKPGLGITLNEEVCKQHLAPNTQWFAPTPEWNTERSSDNLWSLLQEEEKEASRRA